MVLIWWLEMSLWLMFLLVWNCRQALGSENLWLDERSIFHQAPAERWTGWMTMGQARCRLDS